MLRRLLPVALLVLASCEGSDSDSLAGRTGARLALDYYADSDVVGFQLDVERVACGNDDAFEPKQLSENVDLLDGIFPGGIEALEHGSFKNGTRHLGADLLWDLPAGCYNVTATPASEFVGDVAVPSNDCATVYAPRMQVLDGKVTEVAMLSQCVGDAVGGLDVHVTLNHPPIIVVNQECVHTSPCAVQQVCASIVDPDDDPIEVEWSKASGKSLHRLETTSLELVGMSDGQRVWETCAKVVSSVDGETRVQLRAYDLALKGAGDIRWSQLLGKASYDTQIVSVSSMRQDEPLCVLDYKLVAVPGGVEEMDPTCSAIWDEDWYCSGYYPADASVSERVCDGHTLDPFELYPACFGAGH